MHGPLVREKLHGRTANGTWVQLEKTPAAFGRGTGFRPGTTCSILQTLSSTA